MRKHMETLTGKGKLVADGREIAIQYRIDIYQQQLTSTTFTEVSTSPGLNRAEITGIVSDYLDLGATYTLVLSDGRSCPVFAKGEGGPNAKVSFRALKLDGILREAPNL